MNIYEIQWWPDRPHNWEVFGNNPVDFEDDFVVFNQDHCWLDSTAHDPAIARTYGVEVQLHCDMSQIEMTNSSQLVLIHLYDITNADEGYPLYVLIKPSDAAGTSYFIRYLRGYRGGYQFVDGPSFSTIYNNWWIRWKAASSPSVPDGLLQVLGSNTPDVADAELLVDSTNQIYSGPVDRITINAQSQTYNQANGHFWSLFSFRWNPYYFDPPAVPEVYELIDPVFVDPLPDGWFVSADAELNTDHIRFPQVASILGFGNETQDWYDTGNPPLLPWADRLEVVLHFDFSQFYFDPTVDDQSPELIRFLSQRWNAWQWTMDWWWMFIVRIRRAIDGQFYLQIDKSGSSSGDPTWKTDYPMSKLFKWWWLIYEIGESAGKRDAKWQVWGADSSDLTNLELIADITDAQMDFWVSHLYIRTDQQYTGATDKDCKLYRLRWTNNPDSFWSEIPEVFEYCNWSAVPNGWEAEPEVVFNGDHVFMPQQWGYLQTIKNDDLPSLPRSENLEIKLQVDLSSIVLPDTADAANVEPFSFIDVLHKYEPNKWRESFEIELWERAGQPELQVMKSPWRGAGTEWEWEYFLIPKLYEWWWIRYTRGSGERNNTIEIWGHDVDDLQYATKLCSVTDAYFGAVHDEVAFNRFSGYVGPAGPGMKLHCFWWNKDPDPVPVAPLPPVSTTQYYGDCVPVVDAPCTGGDPTQCTAPMWGSCEPELPCDSTIPIVVLSAPLLALGTSIYFEWEGVSTIYTIEALIMKKWDISDPENIVSIVGFQHYETEQDVDAPALGEQTLLAGLEFGIEYVVYFRRKTDVAVSPWSWSFIRASEYSDPVALVDDDGITYFEDDDAVTQIVDVYPPP